MARPKKKVTKVKAKKKTSARGMSKKPMKKMKGARKAKKVKKAKKVSPIRAGYNSVTPYLIVSNAAQAIEFYQTVFGAKQVKIMDQNGKICHAELKFGDSKIMIADEFPEMDARSPESFGGSPVSIYLYVKNVDAVVEKALAAGGKVIRPVADMFWGDRSAGLQDPFGYKWYVATHIEDVTPAQLKKRAAEYMKKEQQC